MRTQRPRWLVILVVLLPLYAAVVLAYRGSRSAADLTTATGPVAQVGFRTQGRHPHVLLQLRLAGVPEVLNGSLGPASRLPPEQQAQLVQQLQTAQRVTARYAHDLFAQENQLYYLAADDAVLIDTPHEVAANRVGSVVALLLFVIFGYVGRRQLFLRPTTSSRHARGPR